MANIVIKDLEMDKELDNISLLQIIGGHGCYPPKKVCHRKRMKFYKKIAYFKKIVKHVKKYRMVPRWKTEYVCYWK